MNIQKAQEFLQDNHRGVLTTYRRAMEREKRVLIQITIDRAGPDKNG